MLVELARILTIYEVKLRLNVWSRRPFFWASQAKSARCFLMFHQSNVILLQRRNLLLPNDTFDRSAIMTLFIGIWNILTNAFSTAINFPIEHFELKNSFFFIKSCHQLNLKDSKASDHLHIYATIVVHEIILCFKIIIIFRYLQKH